MSDEINLARIRHLLRQAARDSITQGVFQKDFVLEAQDAYQMEIERLRQELSAKQELIRKLLEGQGEV